MSGGFNPQTVGTPEYRAYNSQYGFFTRRVNAQTGYGQAIVKVTVPRSAVERDPGSGHYRVKVGDLPANGFTHYSSRRSE